MLVAHSSKAARAAAVSAARVDDRSCSRTFCTSVIFSRCAVGRWLLLLAPCCCCLGAAAAAAAAAAADADAVAAAAAAAAAAAGDGAAAAPVLR